MCLSIAVELDATRAGIRSERRTYVNVVRYGRRVPDSRGGSNPRKPFGEGLIVEACDNIVSPRVRAGDIRVMHPYTVDPSHLELLGVFGTAQNPVGKNRFPISAGVG